MKQSIPNLNKSSKFESSNNLNIKGFNQATNTRSFFKKFTHANSPSSGISTPQTDEKGFSNKSSLDTSSFKKSRMT